MSYEGANMDIYINKYKSLTDNAIQELRSQTDITQLTPGGKARSLLEIINRELGTAYNTFSSDLLQAFSKNSTGDNLDLIGELFGVTKQKSTQNNIDLSNQLQKFYVDTGVFGDINLVNEVGTSFTILSGTLIQTVPMVAGENAITYRVIDDVFCDAAESEAYASIQSTDFGTLANVGAGSLIQHNFEIYADYLNKSLKTTNIEGVAYATDLETDNNYLFRISNQTTAGETGNPVAVRMACLTVPGVSDVVLDAFSNGIGTGMVYVKGLVPVISESLIVAIKNKLSRTVSFGSYVDVKEPPLVGIEMVLGLNLNKRLSFTEEDALTKRVRDYLYKYINKFDLNALLDPDVIAQQVMSIDSNIKSIGTASQRIEQLYVWKYSAATDNRVRMTALSGYQAKNFERIIVEYTALPNSADPIRISILS